MNPPLPDGSAGGGNMVLVGWVLVGTGLLDLLLAFFFALVKPPPDPRSRRVLIFAFVSAAAVISGLGVAFLQGWMGSGG